MTPNRLALLAAAMAVIVIAGVLVGTRINNRGTSQIPANHPVHSIDYAAVTQLLARPLQFQALKPTDPCPDSSDSYGYFGAGPAYGIANAVASSTAWGTYWSVSIVTPLGMHGPVVVRTRDLIHGTPVYDIGPLGVGSVYGTDVYNGSKVTQYQAVAFDTDGVTKGNFVVANKPYVHWDYLQGFKKNWGGGCVGAQIDAPGFTEIFYADVPTN